jgi:hypothetical protein
MKQSEYNNPKSGMPTIWNVESYALSNERVMSILQQAETARVIKALPSMPASKPAKIIWQWVMAVLTWIHIG